MTQVFILAHPDDDVFVRPFIRRAQRAIVCYITCERDPNSRRRESEARTALRKLCAEHDIKFIGAAANAPDGAALDRLPALAVALDNALAKVHDIDCFITHAWEGGHPDHDAAHVLALRAARLGGLLERSWAVSFYRAGASALLPFAIQTPPAGAIDYEATPISWAEAWDMAAAVRYFPSQWTSFAGLGPGIVARALFDRRLWRQKLSRSVAPQRPTTARLLSETRFGVPFSRTATCAHAFLVGTSTK